MVSYRFIFLVLLFAWFASPHAAETPMPGKDKSALCQHCHGKNGVSKEPLIPKLAGQHRAYIMKQIHDFQIAYRYNALMTPMSHAFDEIQDIKDIANYFASQKPMQGAGISNDTTELGKRIYENGIETRGIFACASCHGSRTVTERTVNPMFPVIMGQHKAYLVKQLLDFREQTRLTDPSGIMLSISQSLSKEEISAVADYISGL